MTLDNFVFYCKSAGLKHILWNYKKETCESICHVNLGDTVKNCSDNTFTAYNHLEIRNLSFKFICKERSKSEDTNYSTMAGKT